VIRRTVEISREPAHLAIRDRQLLILRRIGPPPRLPAHPPNLAGSIPLEDLGILIVDERDTTYSHSALCGLVEHGGALVICGRDHQPIGILAPVLTHTELLYRLHDQLAASKPTRKRLWAQLVSAKVRAQASNLDHQPAARAHLFNLARGVRSGDPENVESQAARVYWSAVFRNVPGCEGFRRVAGDVAAPRPNNLLDYGYAVFRAALARALVGAGLLPALGLRHAGRSNFFCLADDLIEPLRPIVDAAVRRLALQQRTGLDQPTKAELLILLSVTVELGGTSGPLEVALPRYAASLARCLAGESERLEIPILSRQALAGMPDEENDSCI
jgi:CRISP-associated protein Cas1